MVLSFQLCCLELRSRERGLPRRTVAKDFRDRVLTSLATAWNITAWDGR
jgi:hypothetical protein